MTWSTVWNAIWLTGMPLAILTGGHAVLRKRSPQSAALWISVSFLLPILGPLLYFLFGINRTTRRARKRIAKYLIRKTSPAGFSAAARLPPPAAHLLPLVRLGDRILKEPLVGGNTVEPLHDGEETYPAMLEAIESAQKSITCCKYIFDYDQVGHQFVRAFSAAAERGVQVKLLVDAVGGFWYLSKVWRAFRKRGIKPATFSPVGLTPTRLMHVNLRNHRKILVVDGQVGFTGSMNISSTHLARNLDNASRFSDIQFRIRGPVVAQLQNAFADDWHFATGQALEGDAFFPMLEPGGLSLARGIADGPDGSIRKLQWIFIGACQAARHSIHIMTPYFIPNEAVKAAVIGAALRGVQVTLVLPAKSDVPLATWATAAYLWEFLEHKVHVVYSGPPFHHTKLTVVDEVWSFLGSANLDARSFRLNFEFNCEVYDADLGRKMAQHVEHVASQGRTLTLAMVDSRSLSVRLRDGFVKLFSPYL